jgi:hypothetical protein
MIRCGVLAYDGDPRRQAHPMTDVERRLAGIRDMDVR